MAWNTKANKIISDKSVLSILLVNIFPILGVIYLNWDAATIIKLYIIETVIIGFFNFKKIKKAKGEIKQVNDSDSFTGKSPKFFARFFFFHYNGFIFIQSIFVVFIINKIGNDATETKGIFDLDFLFSIIFFIISHAHSYYKDYIKTKEYMTASPNVLLFLPYKRIVVQQLTVLIGGSVLIAYQIPLMLVVLVILKTFFDIIAHYKIHIS